MILNKYFVQLPAVFLLRFGLTDKLTHVYSRLLRDVNYASEQCDAGAFNAARAVASAHSDDRSYKISVSFSVEYDETSNE